ncbi:MAG: penicillin-binding protein 1C [Candidatus Riflebacteria bacterium]|nr:penicillin-binding protein 1C [Candidatus Riflebacteria bacterium]
MKARLKKILIGLIIFSFVMVVVWLLRSFYLPYVCEDPFPLLEKHFATGGAYTDRNGRILRIVSDEREAISLYIPLASHTQELIDAVLLAEDRGFYDHAGVSPMAIMRAAWQNLTNNRIVSGASTISQQLIRVIKPRPRILSTKISEALMALRLELKLSKKEILERYLNSVSLFSNVCGMQAASLLLFNKNPYMLNLAESATLAAAIQAPGRFDPFTKKGNLALTKRRNWVLAEMLKNGKCSKEQYETAIKQIIPTYRRKLPFNAPHFCDMLLQQKGKPVGLVATTIDMNLQNKLHEILSAHKSRLFRSGAKQACGMIVDASNMNILAMDGSFEYGPISNGFNNGCLAKRSGGSILKPFLYALAFEKGYYPSFVIPDTMQVFKTLQGDYHPDNASRKSYGPVSIRLALGNSLNISAVKMLNILGIKVFYDFVVDLGILNYEEKAADHFGLGLAIGNPEIRMYDLIPAYAMLVNGGNLRPLTYIPDEKVSSRNIISSETAWLVFDVLADPSARLFTFGNPACFRSESRFMIKTGTSTDYRDGWLVAGDSKFIIALWSGNFTGAPTRGLSGAVACGPIYKDIVDYLEKLYRCHEPVKPKRVKKQKICSFSGKLPNGINCPLTGMDYFVEDNMNPGICTFHKGEGDYHSLSTDYASWLQHRKMLTDVDPYQLEKVERKTVISADNKKETIADVASIKILSPYEGDRYVIMPSHENLCHLRALPSQAVDEVIWIVDGYEFERSKTPYEAYWPLVKGKHTICAMTDGDIASEVTIYVE